ncbi:MAG: zf-HC2 domain-containing protein [Acidobacteriota bacterium]|jgi:anti-sigma factor RsiW
MDCRRIEPRLTPFLDGELGPAEELAVRTHLGACSRCAARLETLRATREAVADLRPEPSDEGWTALERRLGALRAPSAPGSAPAEDTAPSTDPAPGRRSPAARRRRWGLAAALFLAALLAATASWIVDGPGTPGARTEGVGGTPRERATRPGAAPTGPKPERELRQSVDQPCGSAEDCGGDARPLWPNISL